MTQKEYGKKQKRLKIVSSIICSAAIVVAPVPFAYTRCSNNIQYNIPELVTSRSAKENTIYNTLLSYSYWFTQKNLKFPENTKVKMTNIRLNGTSEPFTSRSGLCKSTADSAGNIRVTINTQILQYGIIGKATSAKFDLVFINKKANTQYTLTDFYLELIDEPKTPVEGYENVVNTSETPVTVTVENLGANCDIAFSKDRGESWTGISTSTGSFDINGGETVCFKGNNPNGLNNGTDRQLNLKMLFDGTSSSGGIVLYGNIMSLLDNGGENTNFDRTTIPCDYCFNRLFAGSESLYIVTDNSYTDLFFPAVNLTPHCYEGIFDGCTNLKYTTNSLPAKQLKEQCYYKMFNDCKSLINTPALDFTTVDKSSCENMFNGCENISITPDELQPTVLADSCYKNMFSGCKSLTMAPYLPATTLVDNCYYEMFKDCESLQVNNVTGTLILTCPDLTSVTTPVTDMFDGTGGEYTSDPIAGGKYYYGDPIIHVTGVSLNKDSILINEDESETLIATVTPEEASLKDVIWTTDDPSVATVDENGKVTGVHYGTATITATTVDGFYQATCSVTVKQSTIHVQKVTLNRSSTSIRDGGKQQTLVPTIFPKDATDKTVYWESSDKAVVTVDKEGTITPVGLGTATITCTSKDNPEAKATCDVTIFTPTTFAATEWKILADVSETFEWSSQEVEDMQDLCLDFTDCDYITTGSTVEEHLFNFIGKERKLRINDLDHIVYVIGINHDLLSGETDKYALFTFETKNLLSYKNVNGDTVGLISYWWSHDIVAEDNRSFTTSELYYNLNGGEGQTTYWYDAKLRAEVLHGKTAVDMIYDQELGTPVLKNHLKKVQKEVAMTTDSSWSSLKPTPKTYTATLFPLTVNEVHWTPTSHSKFAVEGKTYAYWADKNPDKSDASIKVWPGQEITWDNCDYYWFVSPRTDGIKKVYHWDGTFQYLCPASTVGEASRVSFAFCI